ncbi:small glutamine-rich tetratricopeptide repeat-containing protein 2 [Cornus florida]|uniref:small glutamine-rich tetratricopeptide repeat-containing protein 2 n=1 Tax=Cornus florida TaxID=4283 RepID=UPI00289FD0F4|nr:small glutamine-rich tetratricopeptide repeat-containing protein 2 [Cornus florida]
MANLKTDSPLCRRIVHAFLDFLDSVEPASGVDLESLEVAKECLAEVFKIDQSSADNWPKPDCLIDIFKSGETSEQQEIKSDVVHESFSTEAPSTSSIQNAFDANPPQALHSLGEDLNGEAHTSGLSKDELFGQFFGALEKIHYFKTTTDGQDDQVQLDRATSIFHNALAGMQKSGCQTFDQKSLAESLKSQGNKAMQSKLYSDAIELYSCAIALCEENAVYYCNRAAAYTQIHQYTEAIRDCLKSIEIDPNYSKAYSRLGFAYYAQGNYMDAINKGFIKALQLDPNNDSVKENIRVAQQKLIEERLRTERNESSSSANHHQETNHQSAGGSGSQGTTPPFASMPFNANGLPSDIASMLMNMAANVYQGQHSQDRPEAGGSTADTFSEPGIRVGGNININLGEQMPEDLTGALRSVMEMFSGAAPSGNPQDDTNRRSAPS